MTWTQPYYLLLKWRFERLFMRRNGSMALPAVRGNDGCQLVDRGAHVTWVGHATFVLRLGGRLITTDPVWRKQIYYLRRLNEPSVALEDLPKVDLVTVTHNHYDHLDLPTLAALNRLHRPLFIVPKRNAYLLKKAGVQQILELDWWESHRDGGVEVTLVPTQHWSQRGPFDKNRSLWGGYGFTPGMGITVLLEYAIGPMLGHELLLTGELVKGAEFQHRGGFSRVVQKKAVLFKAHEIAARIAEKPPEATSVLKTALSARKRAIFESARASEITMHKLTFRDDTVRDLIREEFGGLG